MSNYQLHLGDCRDFLPSITSASVDLVLCDPPYPEINRNYGRMSETDWMEMMQEVVRQSRRILKPTGSAVFILQPNSEKVGKMRLWLWEFMVWCGKEWNIVQDAYWWNYTATTNGVCSPRERGLMRQSVKPSVWIGDPNCYRDQDKVLWSESDWNATHRFRRRWARDKSPSGNGTNKPKHASVAVERGGVIPFNIMPVSNHYPGGNIKGNGHGAGTPQALTDWWTRYLCPTGGVVADWFCGTGTTRLSAAKYGNSFIGCEKMPQYYDVSKMRLGEAYSQAQPALLEVA